MKAVVEDYISHLVRQKVVIPPMWKTHMEKTIGEEVADMLVRKLYGCLTVEDFKEKTEEATILAEKKEARKRYQKLAG